VTGFVDRRPFDPADPDGQALLKALVTVYNQVDDVRDFVRAAGLGLADFSWTQPMSHVWREILRQAADRGLLRRLVTVIAGHGGAAGYDVITRLAAEAAGHATAQEAPAEGTVHDSSAPRPRPAQPGGPPGQPERQGGHLPPAVPMPADDLRGLADDQVRVLRCCATALTSLLAATDAAEATSRLSPEFADVSATMQFELSRSKRSLTAFKRSVGLATWPDTGLAASLLAARNTAQRDVETAQGRPGMPEGTSQDRQRLRRSAAALRTLLLEHYPSLFTPLP
jgi:Effector-associated domain 1